MRIIVKKDVILQFEKVNVGRHGPRRGWRQSSGLLLYRRVTSLRYNADHKQKNIIMKRLIVIICLLLSGWCANAQQPSATFEKIWLEHNVMQDGVSCLKVHVKFTVKNMRNQKCWVVAFFESPQGVGIPDKNGKYCSVKGEVSAYNFITPTSDNAIYNDVTITIPNDEIHFLPGKHDYFTRVVLFKHSDNSEIPGSSEYASFTATLDDNPAQPQNNQPVANNANGGETKIFVDKLGIESGARMNDEKTPCLVIHAKLRTENLKDKKCLLGVYFQFANGEKLKDINHNFCAGDQVAASIDFTPDYTNTTFHDMHIKIPVSELHLPTGGTYSLKLGYGAFDISGGNSKQLAIGEGPEFTIYTYGTDMICCDIKHCSSFAFGKRMGDCYFKDSQSILSTYGYATLRFLIESGTYRVSVGTKYYTYTGEDNDYYIFKQANRKVSVIPTEYINLGYTSVPKNHRTEVTFNIEPNGAILKVAKNGGHIVYDNHSGNAVTLNQELTRNEILAIDRSRGSGSDSPVIIAPYNPGNTDVPVPNPSSSSEKKSKRRPCPVCGGSGEGWEEIVYGPCYVADCEEYCPKCKAVLSPHSHINHSCRGCHGNKYVDW